LQKRKKVPQGVCQKSHLHLEKGVIGLRLKNEYIPFTADSTAKENTDTESLNQMQEKDTALGRLFAVNHGKVNYTQGLGGLNCQNLNFE